MEQHTTPEQTAKLIELGFEKPRLLYFGNNTIGHYAYTTGELIEILPCKLYTGEIYIDFNGLWRTGYRNTVLHTSDFELIDALYEMTVKLKEEGVL